MDNLLLPIPVVKSANSLVSIIAVLVLLSSTPAVKAQKTTVVNSPADQQHKVIIAGRQYKAGKMHRFFWGNNYRPEWTTPVVVPILNIDSAYGGLMPVKQSGHDTKTLRLQTKNGNEYILRLIDKNFGAVLPESVQGTLVEEVVKDQVPAANPFAPLAVPVLAGAAGLYHTDPKIVFVPESKTLGNFNKDFGNTLCLLEESPDDKAINNTDFRNTAKVISTDELFTILRSDNSQAADQKLFVKARLFDMFLGNWGRQENQWHWIKAEEGNRNIYKPVPDNYDQIFTQFNGVLPGAILAQESLNSLQTFNYTIKDITRFNFSERYIDRQLTNEVAKEEWIATAKELQRSLTDAVIEKAIHQLPAEVLSLSGPAIIAKLKSRRQHLVEFATAYYTFLAKEVAITGTTENELFQVIRENNNQTKVEVYNNNRKGAKSKPFYSRTFLNNETKEIRLFGLGGHDTYHILGKAGKGVKLRIIGGRDKDSVVDESSVAGHSHKTMLYDNPGNSVITSAETKVHLSKDTAINVYNYKDFKYDANGIITSGGINTEKGIYITTGYQFKKQQWRKTPFASLQAFKINLSITQKSLGVEYSGIFNQLIGQWNLTYNTGYYPTYTINYYGTGNETMLTSKNTNYNELRRRDFFADAGLTHRVGNNGTIDFTLFYQNFKFLNDNAHYSGEILSVANPALFYRKQFGGAQINYRYDNINDRVLPTKGLQVISSIAHTINLKQTDSAFTHYATDMALYIPLSKKLIIASRSGIAAVTGNPEFYQLPWIGGGDNLRGYYKYRFFGRTALYNNDELMWITDTKNFIFSGKAGVLALFDNGRVWQPGESSDKWHIGYGGGLLVSPFNKIAVIVTYAISEEAKRFNLRFARYF